MLVAKSWLENKQARDKLEELIVRGRIATTLQYFKCIHGSITESIHGLFPTFTISVT